MQTITRFVGANATLYLQMMAFYEGRLRGCRVHDPSGERVGCCCDHDGCCADVITTFKE